MVRMSRLLDEALELDEAGRREWLATLGAEHQDIAEALAEALSLGCAGTGEALSTLPKVAADAEAGLSAASGLTAGERVGPYELIKPLGAGGMAEVWLARRTDGAIKREVALKLPLLTRLRRDLEPRFAREREILAGLSHPNIARLYDAGFAQDGQPYIALEYVVGNTLTAYCDQQHLTIRERLAIFQQVLSAVQYAHTHLVIHRDLKPSNVLVTEAGQVQLLDFGIAKLLSEGEAKETELTQLGGRSLTPDYAAPEQIAGAPITTAADVYALGVMLYEILTGERPYRLKRDTRAALEEAILQTDPVPPSRAAVGETAATTRGTQTKKLSRSLKGDLDVITIKALKKSSRERYQTASALDEDIARFLAGEVVLAQPDSIAYRANKFARRHWVAIAVVGVLILTLAGGLAATSYEAKVASAQRDLALKAQLRLLTEGADQHLKNTDVAGAQGIILEVLTDPRFAQGQTPAAISVFQQTRAADAELVVLSGHGDFVNFAAYSPDSTRIVTASSDKTARIWDTRTGAQLAVLSGHSGTIYSAAYSPDGTRIVTASADKTARIWDARTGAQLAVLSGHGSTVYTAAYSPDGTRIVTASSDKTARIWDARSGAQLAVLSGHGGFVRTAAYSPDGTRIVTASLDNTAGIWDARTGTRLAVLSGHGSSIESAAYCPDGTRIVTASADRTARIWDARTGVQLTVISGHRGWVYSAAYSPDGTRIVTASNDNTARIWDARTGAQLAVLSGHGGAVESAAYSPDGTRIVTASEDRSGRIWDARTGAQLTVLSGHGSIVESAAYSPDGTRIVTASLDNSARIWDAGTGAPLAVLSGHGGSVESAAYSPDDTRIVTASLDHTVRIWDARSGAQLAVLSGHGGSVASAAYSPDGTRIVTASTDKTARIWDARTGAQLAVLSGHGGTIYSAAYSPDGTRIVTASLDHTARIWDARTGTQLAVLSHSNTVGTAAYSPDGTRIVTASNDNTARIWDARTFAQLTVLSGHGGSVTSAAYSPDSTRIVTASDDNSARIWDARTGAQLAVLSGHGSSVESAAYSPDGTRIVTSSEDNTARIWDARIPGTIAEQILWDAAAQTDPLSAVDRDKLGLPTDARVRTSGNGSACDMAAAAFYDPVRLASGTSQSNINADIASPACAAETSEPAHAVRLDYQWARALVAKNDLSAARRQLEFAVSKGYRAAGVDLGNLLTDPTAGMLDPQRAVLLYEKAWRDGVPAAAFALGHLYESGFPGAAIKFQTDSEKAWAWYQKGADAGEPNALARFGEREEISALAAKDTSTANARLLEAFRFYAAAAERAHAEVWPDEAWRHWRYRRATLARLLARAGMMQEVADAYLGVWTRYASHSSTLSERLASLLHHHGTE